jgi:hypothetical protein
MRVVGRPGACVLTWVVALGIVAAGGGLHAKRQTNEQELEARIDGETNPTKKAKLEIQLGALKLGEAVDAYDHNQFDEGPKLIGSYWSWMKKAWELLEKSGRDASRKPQGFKDLDITLRENARRLNDLAHRTPFADRGDIEHVGTEIDALHAQVMAALFPGGQPKGCGPADAPKTAAAPASALRPGELHP